MLKAFIFIMLVVSAASAFPNPQDIAKKMAVGGAQMAACIVKRKAGSAAAALWGKVTNIFGGRRLLARKLNVVTDMAKGVAMKACDVAGFALLNAVASKKGPTYWGDDAKACGRELVHGECAKVIK